jgi:hypothetical protein
LVPRKMVSTLALDWFVIAKLVKKFVYFHSIVVYKKKSKTHKKKTFV